MKNFDELMGAVGVGVRVCLRGASVVDRSNTGFSLTLPAMPLGVEKSKESVLVSVLGMEMRVPASVARNLAELSVRAKAYIKIGRVAATGLLPVPPAAQIGAS